MTLQENSSYRGMHSNILSKYIIKEISSIFIICLFVFTSLLFLIRSLQLADFVVNKSVPLWDMILLFSCIIPRFLEFAIPLSLLISIILAFGRLCADSEVVVMKAAGINLARLAKPVLLFAIGCMCLTFIMTCWLRPAANAKFSDLMFEMATSKANSGIVAGIFNEVGDLVIYAKEVNHETHRLNHVIIGDRIDAKNPRTFIADNGDIVSNSENKTITLRLYNGLISEGFLDEPKITSFSVTSLAINPNLFLKKKEDSKDKNEKELSLNELLSLVRKNKPDNIRALIELNNRVSFPITCLILAVIALTLGQQPARSVGNWGLSASLFGGVLIILFYYVLFSVTDVFCSQGKIPTIFLWLPNICLLGIAVYFFKNIYTEKWNAVSINLKFLSSRTGRL